MSATYTRQQIQNHKRTAARLERELVKAIAREAAAKVKAKAAAKKAAAERRKPQNLKKLLAESQDAYATLNASFGKVSVESMQNANKERDARGALRESEESRDVLAKGIRAIYVEHRSLAAMLQSIAVTHLMNGGDVTRYNEVKRLVELSVGVANTMSKRVDDNEDE